MVSFGAYRSAVAFAKLCAAVGSACADHRLKGMAKPERSGLNVFHISIKKYGMGAQHSVTATAADILAAPVDLTWSLPALFICTDVLLAASSKKHWGGVTRTDFIRSLPPIEHTGWDVDALTRHRSEVVPDAGAGVVVGGADGQVSSVCGIEEVHGARPLSLATLQHYFTLGQPVMFRKAVAKVMCTHKLMHTPLPHTVPSQASTSALPSHWRELTIARSYAETSSAPRHARVAEALGPD